MHPPPLPNQFPPAPPHPPPLHPFHRLFVHPLAHPRPSCLLAHPDTRPYHTMHQSQHVYVRLGCHTRIRHHNRRQTSRHNRRREQQPPNSSPTTPTTIARHNDTTTRSPTTAASDMTEHALKQNRTTKWNSTPHNLYINSVLKIGVFVHAIVHRLRSGH